MDERLLSQLQEATRLTSKGSLAEATALIQRALRKDLPEPPTAETGPGMEKDPIEGVFYVVDTPAPPQDEVFVDIAAGSDARSTFVEHGGHGFIDGTYSCAAGSRAYKLYIPGAYHGQPLPLIVMLHGCTQNPDDFAAGTQMNVVAENKHCFVLYPAQSSQANNSRCWNWFKETDQKPGRGEPAILAGMTQDIVHRYHIDPRRVFIAGLSAGGAMAVIMGTTYPGLYAAIGVHSGLPYGAATDMPSALQAMQQGKGGQGRRPQSEKGLPTIVFHGDHDKTVHPGNGEQLVKQAEFALQGTAQTSAQHARRSVQHGKIPRGHRYTVTVYHYPDGSPMIEHWLVHGSGHAWSGGNRKGSFTDAHGPNASEEMVRFFFAQPMN
ncbi:PHB depolymerase family esterase [Chitinimonas arctica]|uniref:PHB depolymerase family esterase n=1 Tax=Chitinimonas arctica TaxID=2594795 RepID=A0A516SBH4_9NEIS|nr:PHB depolymerase family esterase [Chitinimonas arctica]QDQ25501.1 PHB depolymerase family esterase [Chitinimonas arctica]